MTKYLFNLFYLIKILAQIKILLKTETENQCPSSCQKLIEEAFALVNINQDENFSVDDLDFSSPEAAQQLNRDINKILKKLSKWVAKEPINFDWKKLLEYLQKQAQEFEVTEQVDRLIEKFKTKFDESWAKINPENAKLFEAFDFKAILNRVLNQLNRVSKIDVLLTNLKSINLERILSHPNVKKIVKELVTKIETSDFIESKINEFDYNSMIGSILNSDNLKGLSVNNLLTEANLNLIIESLSKLYNINSIVDRVSSLLDMFNLFAEISLESTLNQLNAENLLQVASKFNFKDLINLTGNRKSPPASASKRECLCNLELILSIL